MIGTRLKYFEVAESTNSLLKAEAEAGRAREGDVIMANHQTAGKGRLDRSWESPPGKGLLFSVLLYPGIATERIALMGLMASLGIFDGLVEYLETAVSLGRNAANQLQLKWPNDILAGGKKLCGILSESSLDKENNQFAVIGAGVNINHNQNDFTPDLEKSATSLFLLTGSVQQRDAVLRLILKNLNLYYEKLKSEGAGWIAETWLRRAGIEGRRIFVKQPNEVLTGICLGLEQNGAIVLRLENGGRKVVYSGDVC